MSDPLTQIRERAFAVDEWANLHGDDLAGTLRLDEEDDAELIAAVDRALFLVPDVLALVVELEAARQQIEKARELLERADSGLTTTVAERDAATTALRETCRYIMEHHGCERYIGTLPEPDDACGECVPCHAVGVVEHDSDCVEALARIGAE